MKDSLTICFPLFLAGGFWLVTHAGDASTTRPPLPYRIVSFHQGRADLELIKLAKEVGFNGVQIQTEYGTLKPLQQFAEFNQRTQLIENCHKLGMQVSIWVHELNDIPDKFLLKPGTGE